MMQQDRLSQTERNYHESWQDVVGASDRTMAPPPVSVSEPAFYVSDAPDGGWWYLWTVKKDELGNWWSCRMRCNSMMALPSTFDLWEAHLQRQQAKARAKANATVARRKEVA